MLALGLWTLYLAFWDDERRPGARPWLSLLLASAAVAIGIGIAGLQVLPFMEYIKYSPRATGGPSTGWEWVNTYAMPPSEIFSTLLPQFNGVLDHYWGSNPLKFHTEYLGVLPLLLTVFAWGDVRRRRLVTALIAGAVVFQLLAFAGHTPFYRPFFEFLPMLKKMRAVGMVFFLVAFPIAILAGIGLDRMLAGLVQRRRILMVLGGFALFGLLGALGVLQVVAEGLAIPERLAAAQANAPDLRLGALRLLFFIGSGGGVLLAVASGKARGAVAAIALVLAISTDLWSIDRLFYQFSPRASVLFGSDEIVRHLQATAPPYRVFNFSGSYPGATLMAYRIPEALGYHGNELRFYDELAGKDQGYRSLQSASLLDQLALRFVILTDTASIPGWHRVAGPISNAFGNPAVLLERDSVPSYARVVVNAAKVKDDQVPPTLTNPRFPVRQVALFADTASVQPAALQQPLPVSAVSATVTEWRPGSMRIALHGRNPGLSYLVISENWYPDWKAMVDGRPAPVLRADHTLLGVVLPSGAQEVSLRFHSDSYDHGKVVSLLSLILACGLIAGPLLLSRRAAGA